MIHADAERSRPFHVDYATSEDAADDLAAAGFVEISAWLTAAPAPLPPDDVEAYLATVVLGSHLEHVAEAERAGFVRAVAERLPCPEIDYVRLNLVARLPS